MKRRIDFDLYKKEVPVQVGGGVISGPVVHAMSSSNALADVMQLFSKQAMVWWVSNGNWNMHELLMALLDITGPADVAISSYAMAETPARVIAQLKQQGVIQYLRCVLDDRIDVRSPGSLQLIRNISDDFMLTKTHAKVTLLRNDTWRVIVMGSANYTENKRYESGIICCDVAGYDKNDLWITKALTDGNK